MSREQLAFSFDEPGTPQPYMLTCADVLTWAQGYTGPKFHAMLLDGPYGLGFMGKQWDRPSTFFERKAERSNGWDHVGGNHNPVNAQDAVRTYHSENEALQAWYTQVFKALAQHLLPGAFIMAFASSRGFHRVMTAMEDAGLRLYPAIFGWLSGQSFPKATRIDVQIDANAPRQHLFESFAIHYAERRKATRLSHHEICVKGGFFAEVNHGGASSNWEKAANVPTLAQWQVLQPMLGLSDEFLPLIQRIEAERDVIGQGAAGLGQGRFHQSVVGNGGYGYEKTYDLTAPATPLAQTWAGHRYGGQMLKNSLEPIIVAQVPYEKKPVESIVTHGSGALWIDGGRIAGQWSGSSVRPCTDITGGNYVGGRGHGPIVEQHASGRWPPNFAISHLPSCVQVGTRQVQVPYPPTGHKGISSIWGNGVHASSLRGGGYMDANGQETVAAWQCAPECPVAKLDAQSGERKLGGTQYKSYRHDTDNIIYGHGLGYSPEGVGYQDTGGASRFFHVSDYSLDVAEQLAQADPALYCAKASRGERDQGLEGMPLVKVRTMSEYVHPSEGRTADKNGGPKHNSHPTVKPIALCRWLATLLLPPDAYAPRRLLIPFAGTGSEAIGALLAGWDEMVLVEQDANYVALAEQRLAYWSRQMVGGV